MNVHSHPQIYSIILSHSLTLHTLNYSIIINIVVLSYNTLFTHKHLFEHTYQHCIFSSYGQIITLIVFSIHQLFSMIIQCLSKIFNFSIHQFQLILTNPILYATVRNIVAQTSPPFYGTHLRISTTYHSKTHPLIIFFISINNYGHKFPMIPPTLGSNIELLLIMFDDSELLEWLFQA